METQRAYRLVVRHQCNMQVPRPSVATQHSCADNCDSRAVLGVEGKAGTHNAATVASKELLMAKSDGSEWPWKVADGRPPVGPQSAALHGDCDAPEVRGDTPPRTMNRSPRPRATQERNQLKRTSPPKLGAQAAMRRGQAQARRTPHYGSVAR